MANIKMGGKNYWYRNFRMTKVTDKKLRKIKAKVGKNWNGTFEELIKIFNEARKEIKK